MNTESIKDKISKLLELAENNSNRNESEQALLKAQKLIADYNINWENHEKTNSEIDVELIQIVEGSNVVNWMANLYYFIAKHNFCDVVVSAGCGSVYLFGRKTNRELVQLIYNNLKSQIEKITELEYKIYTLGERFPIHKKRWTNSFLLGIVSGYNSKMQLQRNEMLRNSNYKSLISLENVLIDQKKAETFKRLQKRQGQSINSEAYSHGVRAGKNLTSQKLLG